MTLTFDLYFQIILKRNKFTYVLWSDRNRPQDHQLVPNICQFIDLSQAIGGHLGNMQIKKLPLGSSQGENDDSSLYWTQLLYKFPGYISILPD